MVVDLDEQLIDLDAAGDDVGHRLELASFDVELEHVELRMTERAMIVVSLRTWPITGCCCASQPPRRSCEKCVLPALRGG